MNLARTEREFHGNSARIQTVFCECFGNSKDFYSGFGVFEILPFVGGLLAVGDRKLWPAVGEGLGADRAQFANAIPDRRFWQIVKFYDWAIGLLGASGTLEGQ
ncbi:MAG TPA: hypothetical protein V6D46_10480 [Coleofasciculaceae cyanobacterium]